MCEIVKDIPVVHSQRCIVLKKVIEKTVLASLIAFDNQIVLEKSLKNAKTEVDSAVETKTKNENFEMVIPLKAVTVRPTRDHNVLCGYTNCHSNCRVSCSFPKSMDKEVFRNILGDFCSACGHSYTYHYHDEHLFEEVEIGLVGTLVNQDRKERFEKAENEEEQAKTLCTRLEEELKKRAVERKRLSEKLFEDISELETLDTASNYAMLIGHQLAEIKTHLQGTDCPESDILRTIKVEMEKKRLAIESRN